MLRCLLFGFLWKLVAVLGKRLIKAGDLFCLTQVRIDHGETLNEGWVLSLGSKRSRATSRMDTVLVAMTKLLAA